MSFTYETLNCLVPVTQFNNQASEIFDRLHYEKHLIVLQNDAPSAVILSPEEFARLSEIEEDFYLLTEAQRRLEKSEGETISFDEVMRQCGITEEDLANAEEPDIE